MKGKTDMKCNYTEEMLKAIARNHIDVLTAWWNKNATEEMKTAAKGKTIAGAYNFIVSVAKKAAVGGCAVLSDDDTFGLLAHYMADEEEGAVYGGAAVQKQAHSKSVKKAVVEEVKKAAEDAKAAKVKEVKTRAEAQLNFLDTLFGGAQ